MQYKRKSLACIVRYDISSGVDIKENGHDRIFVYRGFKSQQNNCRTKLLRIGLKFLP